MEKLIIEHVVGYMLKVLKSGKDISKYKKEFAAIRHGNYDDFIELIRGPIPEMVVYNNGVIKTTGISQKTDFDFAALHQAGPSLRLFYKDCLYEYGQIEDPDLKDDVFERVAHFEIGLRMHANNYKLLQEKENLIDVINKLCKHKNVSLDEISTLHRGRDFVNAIKHTNNRFSSWDEGIIEFQKALFITKKYKLTVT